MGHQINGGSKYYNCGFKKLRVNVVNVITENIAINHNKYDAYINLKKYSY